MARRRGASSVTDLLQGISDDIKDFPNDELVEPRNAIRALTAKVDELGGARTQR